MKSYFALQPALPGFCPISEAVEKLATDSGVEERGAIFTKREVVEFILDLIGYVEEAPLSEFQLLEPSFGAGDFLIPAIERLITESKLAGKFNFHSLEACVRAVELHKKTYESAKKKIESLLCENGMSKRDAVLLTGFWLRQGDFLLTEFSDRFTHVVGNPPYVRQDSVPDVLVAEYRDRFSTIYDRADLYIPFFECSLSLLQENGRLGFICANRCTKNKYGQKLREFISRGFSLSVYVDMVGTDAFDSEVSAYPAITVIERSKESITRVAERPKIDRNTLRQLANDIRSPEPQKNSGVVEVRDATPSGAPWVLESFEELDLVRRLEDAFPTLEEVNCKVGIGVATGADNAFIGDFDSLEVEDSRKLPLVMTRDILDGVVNWRGKGIINPFSENGGLVDLDQFPKLGYYLETRRDEIAGRHVAKKAPKNWYRTIDRIYPSLTKKEKLLIPDIKGDAFIVYEGGKLYPHHNLYYITSDEWDVRALQVVLRSGIARLFVSIYCTRMRGDYLRFQAQYLRKIRLPKWSSIDDILKSQLVKLSETENKQLLREVVSDLYGLTSSELKLVEGISNGSGSG